MKQHHYVTAIIALVLLADWPPARSVCDECLDNTGVHVDFPDPPVDGEHHGAVLFSGWRDYWCPTDVLCTATSSVYLGDVRWRSDQFAFHNMSGFCPKKELVAFVSGRAPTILGDAAGYNFPPADSDWFDPPKQVKVTLWEIDSPAWASRWDDKSTAVTTFDNAGSGISLDIQVPDNSRVVMPPTNGFYYECDSRGSGTAPATGDPSRLRQLASGYDPTSINVYYVQEVAAPGQAWTCPDANSLGGTRDVIFIARVHGEHALAHELGHALGLNRTATLEAMTLKTGDIDELDMMRAFGEENLMFYAGQNPHSLTIGQIYRMHFDVRSWLNKDKSAVTNGYPRVCQDNPVAGGGCPPLALSLSEGWP